MRDTTWSIIAPARGKRRRQDESIQAHLKISGLDSGANHPAK